MRLAPNCVARRSGQVKSKATYDDFVRVARTLEGQQVPTIGGRTTFAVKVIDGVVYVTPQSTGKSRRLAKDVLDALEAYNETASLQPMDYQHLTRNSVYILALLSRV